MTNTEIYDGGYSEEQRELDQAEAAARAEAAAATLAARASALAKLAGLGLTPDEIAALIRA